MRVTSFVITSLMLVAPLVAAPGGGQDDDKVVPTTLDAIRRAPEAYKGVAVRFTIQFAWIGKVENPFFTRFVTSRFANFQAWSDGQAIWQRDSYDDVFAQLFLSKDNEQLEQLFQLRMYQRLEVTAIVRNTFQNLPWIEVTQFTPVDKGLNTPTLAHLYRGHRFLQQRRWQQAISELSLAPVALSPDWVQAAVHKHLGTCYLRLGETDLANQHLQAAVAMLGEDVDHDTRKLAHAAQNDPESELDRAVDRHAVKDHERPIWEAFEKVGAGSSSAPQK